MLKKLQINEVVDEGWFITFDGLMTTQESIQIDEETARTLIALKHIPTS